MASAGGRSEIRAGLAVRSCAFQYDKLNKLCERAIIYDSIYIKQASEGKFTKLDVNYVAS